jgi:hypothetical protein
MRREAKGSQFREVQRHTRVPRIFSYGNGESLEDCEQMSDIFK